MAVSCNLLPWQKCARAAAAAGSLVCTCYLTLVFGCDSVSYLTSYVIWWSTNNNIKNADFKREGKKISLYKILEELASWEKGVTS